MTTKGVPSSSSCSKGFVAAEAFIFSSQNKRRAPERDAGGSRRSLHLADLDHLCPLSSPTLCTGCSPMSREEHNLWKTQALGPRDLGSILVVPR